MTTLGSDWVPDDDGIPHRQAARMVVFAADGRLLLLRGRDGHDPDHQWWFTVGGGLEPGEEPRQAAVRELYEETGIQVSTQDLIGPVLSRSAQFHFMNVTARQDELFYLAFLQGNPQHIDKEHRTELEGEVLTGERWVTQSELEHLAASETVYPHGLAQMVSHWRSGWDGVCRHVIEC